MGTSLLQGHMNPSVSEKQRHHGEANVRSSTPVGPWPRPSVCPGPDRGAVSSLGLAFLPHTGTGAAGAQR